jgi:RNA polymerase sigma factor (sigma-70 family)
VEASALHAPQGLSRISAAGPLLRLRGDDQLVALFRMGYDDAFRVIHDRYRHRLFAYTRQMLAGSRSDAEDALQDVFLRAYGALRQDDRPITLRAWLYRVAHNRCVDHLRRPLPAAVDLFDVTRTPLHDPLAEAERREDLRRLVADVRRLPEQQRSALLMRELEGLSYAELADALGVTVPAVKSLLVRARIGLVEASDARDTACSDIRSELALAFDRGVRASGRSRRHLRDCAGCRDYRRALRGAQAGLGALSPGAGPLATIAKLLGIGGAGSGAAAGGTVAAGGGAAAGGAAAAGGGGAAAAGSAAVTAASGGAAAGGGLAAGGAGAALAGGSAVTATATKVAAIVGAAAVVGGGAAEVKRFAPNDRPARAPARTVYAPAAAHPAAHPLGAGTTTGERGRARLRARQKAAERRRAADAAPPAVAGEPAAADMTSADTEGPAPAPPSEVELQTGGMAAPGEEAPSAPSAEPAETVPAAPEDASVTEPAPAVAAGAAPGTAPAQDDAAAPPPGPRSGEAAAAKPAGTSAHAASATATSPQAP